MNLNINYKLIVFISTIFSLIVGFGFYGFGNDYYEIYQSHNLDWPGWKDHLGFRISTLSIYGKHIGVFLVSFILAISSGILLRNFLEYQKINSIYIYTYIYIVVLHTWPIIMSTSNAMRQGIAMSFIFFSFAYLLKKKNFISFFFIFISIFTHKTGIFFLTIFVISFAIKFIVDLFKDTKYLTNLHLILNILFFYLFLILLSSNFDISETSRVIAGDYRLFFIIISLTYISIFAFKYKLLMRNDFSLILYLFSSASSALLFVGMNWQYERLMMIMIIPYIMIFSTLFDKKLSIFFLILSFTTLFGITILNGMYSSLK